MEIDKRMKEQDEFLKPHIDRVVSFDVKPQWRSIMRYKVYAIVRYKIHDFRLSPYTLEVISGKKGVLMPDDIDQRTFRVLPEHEAIVKRLELETIEAFWIPREYFPFDTSP